MAPSGASRKFLDWDRPSLLHPLSLLAVLARFGLLGMSGGCAALAVDTPLDCEVGTEGCVCYGNWSCNYRLSCVDDLCVDNQSRSDSERSRTTEAALLVNDPLMSREAPECIVCAESDCSASLERCYETPGCAELSGCLLNCSRSDGEYFKCSRECYLPAPVEAHVRANGLHQCLNQTCRDECYPQTKDAE